MRNIRVWPTGAILLIISFIIGFSISQKIYSPEKEELNESEQIRLGEGKLTNPLLECEVADNTINSKKIYFDHELKDYISKISAMNGLTNVSLYFRDMNNGPVIEINTSNKFMPASLLKVPVMITYFKKAETNPEILKKNVYFDKEKELGFTQKIRPEKQLVPGKTYTVEELIEQMIKYSDNQALALLWPILSIDEYKELYREIGVDEKVVEDPSYSITVKEYSRFMRILFNSSYLNQEYSERALKILSESTFDDGIRNGVPEKVTVADKFGEREINSYESQIHDCGLVYYPDHPYMLCVMTNGTDRDKQLKSIANISDFIFNKINSSYSLIKKE
jgi:beta-lactamase class A